MKRLFNLIIWDIKFQMKYGFYFLYGVLSIFYLIILFAIPLKWQEKASIILIFSDPAAMGLFFMGAIILLEKSQKIPYSLAVSPIKSVEYIISKILSLCFISVIVAAILTLSINKNNLFIVLIGTAISSSIFTLLGIIVATKISSVNQFILWTTPIEILTFVPGVLHLFQLSPEVLKYYPINICIDLISKKPLTLINLLILIFTFLILLFISNKCVIKMWENAGGVKL
jgi:fluoroquinolone transport system permease protein